MASVYLENTTIDCSHCLDIDNQRWSRLEEIKETIMTNQSLSDLWRENRSKDPGVDLASILDGARIMAQSLNPKVEVTFAGIKTANTDRETIFLSPRELGNEYPVPGKIVDVLLGLTVHEVGHTLFSDNKAIFTDKLARKAGVSPYSEPGDYKQFKNLINIFEDIYVDHLLTAYPGYRDYLQRERDHALGEINPESVKKPLEAKCIRKDIFNALIYFTLAGGKLPDRISDENMKTLAGLAAQANKMCTKKTSKSAAILNAWMVIKAVPTSLTDEERGFGQPAPIPGEGEPQPASDKAQNHADEEQKEQKNLEKQDEETTEEGENDGEAESQPGETESEDKEGEPGREESEAEDGEPGREESEEESGETEPTNTGEGEQETKEGEGEEGGFGYGESEAGGDIEGGDDGENEEEDEIGIDSDLDLASMIDELVEDTSKLSKELAEGVSEAIVEKRADLTQLLSYLAKDSNYTIVAYTPKEDAEAAAKARSNTAEAEEVLRRILQDYRLRRTRDYRGLLTGRISTRRLHRAAYGDKRVFQRREKPEEIDMAVCLLMDLSGSVHRFEYLIEQIVCATSDAFQKEKVEFIALGYSENRGTVTIPRLYDREIGIVNLSLDKEWGMTPSYEGLAAAIAQLLRLTGKKDKVLFHFTDGSPNSGNSHVIPELLEDARAKGITDIHICMTSGDVSTVRMEGFKTIYGEGCLPITDINQLPEVIEQILRERLKV